MEWTARASTLYLSVVLTFFGGSETILAQNVQSGRRLSERWCNAPRSGLLRPNAIERRPLQLSPSGSDRPRHDRLIFALAPCDHAQPAAQPQRRPGYRGAYSR